MKLPKASADEERPFIGNKKARIALDNLAVPGSSRAKYGAKTTSSLFRRLLRNTLVRWILLVLAMLLVFVMGSSYFASVPNAGFNAAEVPELDFTLDNLISASIGLSSMAAEAIRDVKRRHKEDMQVKGKTKEGVDEPVTEADREANEVIINGLRTLFQKSRAIGNEKGQSKIKFDIISEETDPKYQQVVPTLEYIDGVKGGDVLLDPSKISIIVDPLDATKEFTEETDTDGTDMLPYVTTLICIVEDETPIAGIVGRPFVNEPIMWGVATEQAQTLHGVKAVLPDERAQGLVTVSRSHTGKGKDVVRENLGKESLPAGGAGYKSFLVLTGKVDAYIHVTAIKTWDLCAGHALLKAIGGDITDKDGVKLSYTRGKPKFENGLIASQDKDKIQQYAAKLKDISLGRR